MTKSDNEIIQEIIDAFGRMALGDIEYNIKDKPIAAFILCSCLIDQLATFVYHKPNEKNNVLYKRFISEYLPHLKHLNLYVNLRCKLVHNYTVGKFIKLSSEDAPFEHLGLGKIEVLTAPIMYNELKTVFKIIESKLNDPNSPIRKNAISQYKFENSQIIAQKTEKFTTYLEGEANILINHFTPILCHKINEKGIVLDIQSITKKDIGNDRFLVVVNMTGIINKKEMKESTQIDVLLDRWKQESSQSVLNRLNPTQ